MCTVTLLTRARGYALGMNRDERRTRIKGLPPRRKRRHGRVVLEPSEPGGGSWLSLNDGGACLALINWYAVTHPPDEPAFSRGVIVQSVSNSTLPGEAETALANLPLHSIKPFRLIGVFPATRSVLEWRWDLRRLVRLRHRWASRQWASSGFDEGTAQIVRGKVFQQSRRKSKKESLAWLRRLHRSHAPERGPFSTCMHRAEAATVSYTEVAVTAGRAVLRHHNGAPCETPAGRPHRLKLRPKRPRKAGTELR